MVKFYAMVKNEADIVRDWVAYHASIVGLKNIFVLDNMSTDGTFEILKQLNVPCSRTGDYSKKGEYTTAFLRNHPNELIIPLDIDEFFVLYDSKFKTISTDNLYAIIANLPLAPVYKMPYIMTNCSKDYCRATLECGSGTFIDYGESAKSFFHTKVFQGVVDHGNHYPVHNYFKSPFILVHYHDRNYSQSLTKTKANVQGLGYDLNDRASLRQLLDSRCKGFHHVAKWLAHLEGTYAFPYSEGNIDLTPLSKKILALTTKPKVLGVIARYNENLEWMLEAPFSQIKYVVYNKGVNSDFCKANVVSVVNLPNIGRCDHTFLYHTVKQYSAMEDVVVFLPGSIDIPFKKEKASRIITHALKHHKPAFVVQERVDVQTFFKDFVINEWKCIHPDNSKLNDETALIPSRIRPFGTWYQTHFGNLKTNFYTLHGIFSVSPTVVHRRSLQEYKSLLDEVSQGSNVEVGHYLERAWGAVFRGMEHQL